VEDVLYKHSWFVDYLNDLGREPLPFVGKFKASDKATEVAHDIRERLGLADAARQSRN